MTRPGYTRRACLSGAAAAAVAPLSVAAAGDRFGAVRRVLKRAVAEQAVPWAGLLVVQDGKDVFAHMEGAARDHVDMLRSATKLATVTCVMTLVQSKALRLEDPISRYIPGFDGDKAAITVRHLLSMNSGLPASYAAFSDNQTLAEAAETIARAPLAARPGEGFIYGNLGLTVAGRVAEIVAGESWDGYFARAVARPLGMTFEYGPLGEGRLGGGRLGGGGRTSLDSYGRLLKMHLAGGRHHGKPFLDRKLVALMQAPNGSGFRNPYPELDAIGYGMGWWLDRIDRRGQGSMVSDPGAWGAYPWMDLRRRYGGFLFMRKQLVDGVKLQREVRPLIEAALA